MRKVGAWAELQSAVEVSFPQSEINGKAVDPFFNINRPEDLAKAEALLKAVLSGRARPRGSRSRPSRDADG